MFNGYVLIVETTLLLLLFPFVMVLMFVLLIIVWCHCVTYHPLVEH